MDIWLHCPARPRSAVSARRHAPGTRRQLRPAPHPPGPSRDALAVLELVRQSPEQHLRRSTLAAGPRSEKNVRSASESAVMRTASESAVTYRISI